MADADQDKSRRGGGDKAAGNTGVTEKADAAAADSGHLLEGTIAEGISGLQKLFKARERELDERERSLAQLKAELEKEHPALASKRPSDVIRLNVGGSARIDVLRRTLTSVEGSLLASQFSGRWDESLNKDADGNFFLDHPGGLFLVLVDYLRDRELAPPVGPALASPFPGSSLQNKFLRILEHYGVTLAVYPFSLYRIEGDGEDNAIEAITGVCPGTSLTNSKARGGSPESYILKPAKGSGHRYKVRAFEVDIEKGTKAMIGFASDSLAHKALAAHRAGTGAGYFNGSIAIDIARNGIAFMNEDSSDETPQQEFLPMEGTDLSGGVSVRGEDGGRVWHVQGKEVAAPAPQPDRDDSIVTSGFTSGPGDSPRWPIITVYGGALRFVSVEVDFDVTSHS
jgi:hypothetical protein